MKNDKKDASAIARLSKYQYIKISIMPEPQILDQRMMIINHYAELRKWDKYHQAWRNIILEQNCGLDVCR
jgi:hypothetical protein